MASKAFRVQHDARIELEIQNRIGDPKRRTKKQDEEHPRSEKEGVGVEGGGTRTLSYKHIVLWCKHTVLSYKHTMLRCKHIVLWCKHTMLQAHYRRIAVDALL
jgi:hypothetical protein